jgi:branched-chain amino acid transport system substrate-binding protein
MNIKRFTSYEFIRGVVLTIVLLVATACGPAAPPVQAPASTEAAAPTEAAVPATEETAEPTEAAAVPATEEAAEPTEAAASTEEEAVPAIEGAGEPIVIAVTTDLGTIEGQSSLNSVMMAVEEINAAGGISLGGEMRPFELVSTDTRDGSPDVPVDDALQSMERLILEEKPAAIVVGNLRSEVMIAAMDLVSKYKLPYLGSIAATPAMQQKVTEDYDVYKYVFRVGLNGPGVGMYLTQAMGFLNEQFDFTRAYIVHQDVAWATGTADGLEKWFQGNGWEVVGKDPYPTGATEFTPSINQAVQSEADVIVPIFDMPSAGILLKQAKAMQAPSLFAGFISPVAPPGAWDAFEGEVDGMVNLSFEIGNLPVKAVPASVEYFNKYGEKYGAEALATLGGHAPAPSYDSVYILKAAIERAGSLDGDALVEALEATDYEGAMGRIRFGEDHQVIFGLDPAEAALGAVFQWKEGKRVPVFPPAVAEGEIELPSQ